MTGLSKGSYTGTEIRTMLTGERVAAIVGVGLTLSLIIWGSVTYGFNPSAIAGLILAGTLGTTIAIVVVSRIK